MPRLVIFSAIAYDREIFLLDEPTSRFDFTHKMERAALLRQLQSVSIVFLGVTLDRKQIRAYYESKLEFYRICIGIGFVSGVFGVIRPGLKKA